MTASSEAQVAHVWRRLGFGPAPGDVEAGVAAGGATAVVEDLLARPATTATEWAWPAEQGNWDDNYRFVTRLFELWAHSPSVVQERISWSLAQLLVAGLDGGLTDFREVKGHHSRLRGWPSASYKSLLTGVAESGAMQKYLNGVFSNPFHPNENLARELMELFSLGVTNPRTGALNYTETDVQEIARALTGYVFDDAKTVYFHNTWWDAGNKTFLGADRGAAKLPEVIDAIAAQDSFKYFVPQHIYRELIGTDPSASALDAMAAVWAANGDLGALVAHIAHRPEFLADATIHNRVKSPVELLTSSFRVLGKIDLTQNGSVPYMAAIMWQLPNYPPDVFGWSDNWLHPSHLITWSHVAYWLCWSDRGPAKDGTAEATPPLQQNPTIRRLFAEADRTTAADLALKLAGLYDVSPQTRSAVDAYANHVAWAGDVWTYERACGVMQLVFNSPEFLAS